MGERDHKTGLNWYCYSDAAAGAEIRLLFISDNKTFLVWASGFISQAAVKEKQKNNMQVKIHPFFPANAQLKLITQILFREQTVRQTTPCSLIGEHTLCVCVCVYLSMLYYKDQMSPQG